MRQSKFFLVFTFLIFALTAYTAFADDDIRQYKVNDFPEEFRYQIERGGSYSREQLSSLLFDSVSHLKIYNYSQQRFSAGLRVGRAVYDNHDVGQSYTVVDTMQLPITLFSWGVPIAGTNFYFSLGIGGDLTFTDLRQVTKSGFRNLPNLDERVEGVNTTDWWKETAEDRAKMEAEKSANPDNPPYTEAPKDSDNPLFHLDSLNSARYSRFWNQLSFPARLPFRADWVERMDVGEVITYGGSGFIELGPGFSAVTNALDINRLIQSMGLSAEYKFFVRGEYRIAIYREDENHVKVKVTRRDEYGTRASVGASSQRVYWFDGFAVFGREVGRWGGGTVMPFNFQRVDSRGDIVEEGFRFDLRDPAAREAYELAVIGRFAKADEVATKEAAANAESPAVERIFHKNGKEQTERRSRGLKIILYSQDRSSEERNQDVDLILKDGKHKVYSATVENRFESKLFFGSRERSVTRTTIDFSDSILNVVLEGWIEDSQTYSSELVDYENIVEKVIGRGQIFPRLPGIFPKSTGNENANAASDGDLPGNQDREANYGDSSFYWRLDANAEQTRKFINTPDDEKWKVLERVFGITEGKWESPTSRGTIRIFSYLGRVVNLLLIPVDLRFKDMESPIIADSIFENWQKLGEVNTPAELTKTLARQFSDTIYGIEMMQVFTTALARENLPFFLTASNLSFGRVSIQEGRFSSAGQTLEEYRRASNIENPELGQNINLVVGDFRAQVLDENRVALRFKLTTKPNYVYFRVDSAGFFSGTNEELIVLNLGQFQAGENELILDKQENNYRGALARAFNKGPGFFELFMGAGLARRDWGPVANTRVYYPFSPLPPQK